MAPTSNARFCGILACLLGGGGGWPANAVASDTVATRPPPIETGNMKPRGPRADTRRGVTVTAITAYGQKAVRLRNRTAEIVIVPGIGRVMGFALLDGRREPEPTPFWSHPEIDRGIQPDGEGWRNHGGEKALPAPQSDWARITGRGWPPPTGFDARPHTATLRRDSVVLVSPVDADYGIRVRRTIALDADKPVMSIETTYQKVQGAPVGVAVWTIAQLWAPERLFVLLPDRPGASFPNGYISLLPDAPFNLKREGRLLSLGRHPRSKTMLSSDGGALLWVGSGRADLLVEDVTPDPAGLADGGDGSSRGTRSQIYTAPGDDSAGEAYVELELLGRVRELKPGQATSALQRYTLIERSESDPSAEARRVFGLP